jgi:ribosomal protein S7
MLIISKQNKNKLVNNKKFLFTYKNFKKVYFSSLHLFILSKVVNNLMKSGKKDVIFKIINILFFKLRISYRIDPSKLLTLAILRIKPVIRLKKRKIAGRNHYLPLFLSLQRQILLGSKLFVKSSKFRVEQSIILKLFFEIKAILIFSNESLALKKKDDLYKLAIENKYFIKFL